MTQPGTTATARDCSRLSHLVRSQGRVSVYLELRLHVKARMLDVTSVSETTSILTQQCQSKYLLITSAFPTPLPSLVSFFFSFSTSTSFLLLLHNLFLTLLLFLFAPSAVIPPLLPPVPSPPRILPFCSYCSCSSPTSATSSSLLLLLLFLPTSSFLSSLLPCHSSSRRSGLQSRLSPQQGSCEDAHARERPDWPPDFMGGGRQLPQRCCDGGG